MPKSHKTPHIRNPPSQHRAPKSPTPHSNSNSNSNSNAQSQSGGQGKKAQVDEGGYAHTPAPEKTQQGVLDVFAAAYGGVLGDDGFGGRVRGIKRALWGREFGRAFGGVASGEGGGDGGVERGDGDGKGEDGKEAVEKTGEENGDTGGTQTETDPESKALARQKDAEQGLFVYAAQWSPGRALCYAGILQGLLDSGVLDTVLLPDDSKEKRRITVTSLGGGPAELAAFATLTSTTNISLHLLDSAPYAPVLAALMEKLTTPLAKSAYNPSPRATISPPSAMTYTFHQTEHSLLPP